jgi:hypothetical protein
MDNKESDSADPASGLRQLIAEHGRTADPRIENFVRVASAVQRMRRRSSASDTDRITRSTALWTLLEVDNEVAAALTKGGIDKARLGRELSISAPPREAAGQVADLHEDFAWAVRGYLATRPAEERRPVVLADVASAIIRTGRDSRGLLPKRLNDLEVDYDVIMSELDRLIPTPAARERASAASPPQLSETMRSVAKELSTTATAHEITAFEVAQAIARRHPEYAGGLLGEVTLTIPPDAVSRTWSDWRADVAALYERAVLAETRHRVLSGRLFLIGLGYHDAALRNFLSDKGVWGPLVLEVDEAVAPATSRLRSVLQAVQFGYGYLSDQATGDDQLGIQGEVNAVCEVIVDPEVMPPLAVGLFGKWGTGKSFFMGKMRERIAERSRSPRDDDSDDGQLSVVQIRFNAWHYADTSLWASLAIEIFERLVDPEPVGDEERARWLLKHGDVRRDERQSLLTQLETYHEAKAALETEQSRLENEHRRAKERVAQAREQQREKIDSTTLTDVAGELAKDPEVVAAVGQVAKALALEPAAEELTTLGSELRTTGGYLASMWRLGSRKTLGVVLATVGVVLLLATTALILRGGWLAALATAAGSVGTVVVTALNVVRPAAQKVNDALAVVESAISTASAIKARLRSRRGREERALEMALAELDREITEATQAMVVLQEKIATTAAAADALSVGRRLYDFLTDRAVGYQKHQGVVGMLHRDFRFLDAQLRAYRADPGTTSTLPRIDRVVLYIDDLDRCPPAKVLEVLEAVHLLLALELFVVVVGVDPRWLRNSLRHQYQDLVTSSDPRTDPYMSAMPIEYLEKIFQIPFTLPAMEPHGYARLITSIAGPQAQSRPSEVTFADAAHPSPASETAGIDREPTRAPLDVQPGSSASGDVGDRVQLTRAEIEFAQQLGALVNSPRAAKRLMNTYRLIRATQHVDSRSRFLGGTDRVGEYQAVLTLLAVAAGYPAMADRLLVALQNDAPTNNIRLWSEFISELRPPGRGQPAGRLVPPDLTDTPIDDANRGKLIAWTNLYDALTARPTANGLDNIEPYQRWGRIVARFSFTL